MSGPWTAIWVALQELGAALDDAGDLPDWAARLSAVVDASQTQAEEAALSEENEQ